MTVTPQGNIKLLNVPLWENYEHTLSWKKKQDQINYFNSLSGYVSNDYTYIKNDNVIYVNESYDNLIKYNYLIYTNTGFTTKTYFCFITAMNYENENCTSIKFTTDVIQTYYFDVTFLQSFVEREHVSDDKIGLHTIPENLETGDYINQGDPIKSNFGNYYICVGLSEDILINDETNINHNFYNGIISGITYVALKDITSANRLIFRYNQTGKIEALYSLFMIPEKFLSEISWQTDDTGTINFQYISNQDTAFELSQVEILKPRLIGDIKDGFIPKNNKVLTYPYVCLESSNNVGTNVIYPYEFFKTENSEYSSTCIFKIFGSISPGCNIKTIPQNYKEVKSNLEEGFNCAKLPLGSWTNDVYTNWLTQNGVNIAMNLGSSVFQIASGVQLQSILNGNLLSSGNIASGFLGITNDLASIYSHSIIPNQVEGEVNSSDIIFALKNSEPSFYQKTIKTEYAKIIDDYLTHFGYKVNEFKVPQFNSRENWNYIKLKEINIKGDIPQLYEEEFSKAFKNGITFWHNVDTFLDYSQENNIV